MATTINHGTNLCDSTWCSSPTIQAAMTSEQLLLAISGLDLRNMKTSTDANEGISLILTYLKISNKNIEEQVAEHPCDEYLKSFCNLLEKLAPCVTEFFAVKQANHSTKDEQFITFTLYIVSKNSNFPIIELRNLKDDSCEASLQSAINCQFNIAKIQRFTWKTRSIHLDICGIRQAHPIINFRKQVGASSVSVSYPCFPQQVEFIKAEIAGATQVDFFDGKSNELVRNKHNAGNAIGLINTIVHAPGEYNYTFVVEKDIGASCCIGIVTISKLSIDAAVLLSEVSRANIYANTKLCCIRSFRGAIYRMGEQQSGFVQEFWPDNSVVNMKIIVENNKANVYFSTTVTVIDKDTNKAIDSESEMELIFSDLSLPLQPFAGFYAGMEKKLLLMHGEFKATVSPQHPQVGAINPKCRQLTLPDWPRDIMFTKRSMIGDFTLLSVGRSAVSNKIARSPNQNNVDFCRLNCICSSTGEYEFIFDIEDEKNAACIGFYEQKSRTNILTSAPDTLFGNKALFLIRIADAAFYNQGKLTKSNDIHFIDLKKTKIILKLVVNEGHQTDIFMILNNDKFGEKTIFLSRTSLSLTPFVAFFGKGEQTATIELATKKQIQNKL